MEPFVIQCTTCKARLKVSDPGLVGDIVGCPKCESFVQVTPPPGWQAPSPSTAQALASPAANTGSASGTIALERGQKPSASTIKQPAALSADVAAPLAPPPLPAAALSATGFLATGFSAMGKTAPATPRAAAGISSLIVPEPAAEPGALAQLLAAVRRHYWISIGGAVSAAAVVTIAWLALGPKTETAPTADLPDAAVALGSNSQRSNSQRSNSQRSDSQRGDQQSGVNDSHAADRVGGNSGRVEPADETPATDSGIAAIRPPLPHRRPWPIRSRNWRRTPRLKPHPQGHLRRRRPKPTRSTRSPERWPPSRSHSRRRIRARRRPR